MGQNPLCRFAASPPEGAKNCFRLWNFSPTGGSGRRPRGDYNCQNDPGKVAEGRGGYKIRKGVPFWNALLTKVGDDPAMRDFTSFSLLLPQVT